MHPSRPRIRAGLSRRGVPSVSRRLSLPRPISSGTARKPLHPVPHTPNVPGKQAPLDKSKHFFAVLYAKNSRKKHKSWQDGYIIVTDDRHVAMHDDDGKHMLSERVARLGGLVDGNTLELRSWIVEVQHEVSEEDFLSGRLFLRNAVAPPTRAAPRPRKAFKPLMPRGIARSQQASRVLHDANAPDAVLLARGEHPVVLDPCLARRMRPHQLDGVRFLFNCVRGDGGAILADDMGLGKSLQAIALVWTLLRQGAGTGGLAAKAAIVCPASLVTNWVNEVRKWLGDDRLRPVSLASGSSTFESKQSLSAFVNGNVKKLLIVSYEMFRGNSDALYTAGIGLLICDEGHRLKSSHGNKTIESLRKLPCRRRVILTGTPVQNDLEEFFAVCDFVNPGCLNSLQSFRSVFAGPIMASRDSNASPAAVRLGQARARELSNVTSAFVLRRTSNILEKYLPPKQETAIFCRLQAGQEKDYGREASSRYIAMDTSKFCAALSAINYLRKICSHPVLVKQGQQLDYESDDNAIENEEFSENYMLKEFEINDSSKMQVAISICEASQTVKDRLILVSNFTSTLDLLQEALVRKKIVFCRLDGKTPVNQRGDIVRRFNQGTMGDVFLLSAKAGGVGLNLIGANRLILFDPDWNPATDLQAMARVWRDGQTKPVYVYRLLSTGTIEEKIFQRQLFKGELQCAVGADKHGGDTQNIGAADALSGKEGNFNREQLRDLFQYNGGLEYCETLGVLERSQLDGELNDRQHDDKDPKTQIANSSRLLERFSAYKIRFESDDGIRDYMFCDDDMVLDNALNGNLKTHGLVSYLYTEKSGSHAELKEQKAQSTPDECDGSGSKYRESKTAAGPDERIKLRKRKVEAIFTDESDDNKESSCDSDSELAAMVARSKSRGMEKRKDVAVNLEEDLVPRVDDHVGEEPRELKTSKDTIHEAQEAAREAIVPKAKQAVATDACTHKLWDDVVNALECDDMDGVI